MGIRKELDRWLLRHPMPSQDAPKEERMAYFDSMPEHVHAEWALRKAILDCEKPEYNSGTAERAQKRMARVDAMAPETRELVYEFGLEVVQEFLNHGVRSARSIRHLIGVARNEREDGMSFFRPNAGKNQKANPAAKDADDDFYFVAKTGSRS